MSRTIIDRELKSWEAYATTGDFGLTAPAKIAFRCTSDGSQRPRVVDFEGDKSEAERAVLALTVQELLEVLERSAEVA
jgi:hypothetical protein